MAQIYLSLGSNLGDKINNLAEAVKLIAQRVGKVSKQSSLYETAPWGFQSADSFINQIICVDTKLRPYEVLQLTQQVERKLGRKSKTPLYKTGQQAVYSSRTMDIDIIFFDNLIYNHSELMIPHPHMFNRRFVLEPLAEIAANFFHPIFNKSVAALLSETVDKNPVKKMNLIEELA